MKTVGGQTKVIDVLSSDTIGAVKSQLQWMEGISSIDQRLTYAGKELEDGSTIKNCGITKLSTLYMALRVRGGVC